MRCVPRESNWTSASSFRRALILPHLDGWLHQRFWGRPVSHGEDQALTNIILRAGYDTVFQRTAVVRTLTPERYRQLARMLTRYRDRDRLLPIVAFVMTNVRIVLLYTGLALLPSFLGQHPQLAPPYALAFVVASVMPALYHLQHERNLSFLWGVLYSFYAFLLLQWTLPWALLTVRDERWGTR